MPRIQRRDDVDLKRVETSGIYVDKYGHAFKLLEGEVFPSGELTLRKEVSADQSEPTVSAEGAAEAAEIESKANREKRAEPGAPENRAELVPENR